MCSIKEAVVKNFAIFKGKHLCWSQLKPFNEKFLKWFQKHYTDQRYRNKL